LLIGLETHHGRLSMNHGVANPIKRSAHSCNGYLGNSPTRANPIFCVTNPHANSNLQM
jgi:hypothetical protein